MDSIYKRDNSIKVSVIMLTYNRAPLILESVKSVLEQCFEDLELVIIDDGSTDNTKDVIKDIKDPRVSYYNFEHTGKISYLRNLGIAHAKGEYIAYIDSDDLWQKDKLKNQVLILNDNQDIGMTFSDVEFFNENGIFRKWLYNSLSKKYSFYKGSIFQFLISNQMAIYASSVMFRRNCIEKVGLLDERLNPGDSNFFIRLSYLFDVYIVFDYWTKIRKHDGNMSPHIHEISFHEMTQTIISFYDSKDISKQIFNKAMLSLQYGFALDFWRNNNFKRSRKELLACLRINPFFIKPALRYIISYLK